MCLKDRGKDDATGKHHHSYQNACSYTKFESNHCDGGGEEVEKAVEEKDEDEDEIVTYL
jgi:hypothetical protein